MEKCFRISGNISPHQGIYNHIFLIAFRRIFNKEIQVFTKIEEPEDSFDQKDEKQWKTPGNDSELDLSHVRITFFLIP